MEKNNPRLESGRFLTIDRLFAFISKDKDGNEGLLGGLMPNGMWMAFIGADMDRVESLKPIADEISKTTGMAYDIRKFVRKDKLEKAWMKFKKGIKQYPLYIIKIHEFEKEMEINGIHIKKISSNM